MLSIQIRLGPTGNGTTYYIDTIAINQLLPLPAAQTRIVEARFDSMEEVAGRLGRKDWTGIFVNSLIGIATMLTLSADSRQEVWIKGYIPLGWIDTSIFVTFRRPAPPFNPLHEVYERLFKPPKK